MREIQKGPEFHQHVASVCTLLLLAAAGLVTPASVTHAWMGKDSDPAASEDDPLSSPAKPIEVRAHNASETPIELPSMRLGGAARSTSPAWRAEASDASAPCADHDEKDCKVLAPVLEGLFALSPPDVNSQASDPQASDVGKDGNVGKDDNEASAAERQKATDEEALVDDMLRALQAKHGEIADHIQLVRARRSLRARAFNVAEKAFLDASKSVTSEVALEAREGRLRAMVEALHPRALAEIGKFSAAFPSSPAVPRLLFAMAQTHLDRAKHEENQERGLALGSGKAGTQTRGTSAAEQRRARLAKLRHERVKLRHERMAQQLYRRIDREHPETHEASLARAALKPVRPGQPYAHSYPAAEAIARAQRLVRRGSVEAAEQSVAELQARRDLKPTQRDEVAGLAHILDRRAGRDIPLPESPQEALEHEKQVAQGTSDEPLPLPSQGVLPSQGARPPPTAQRERQVVAGIRKLVGWRPLSKVQSLRLLAGLRVARQEPSSAEALAWVEKIFQALDEQQALPSVRMRAITIAGDMAGPKRSLIVASHPSFHGSDGSALRHHRARALEQLGRSEEAEATYRAQLKDARAESYYRIWAKVRLRHMAAEATATGPSAARAARPSLPLIPVSLEDKTEKAQRASWQSFRNKRAPLLTQRDADWLRVQLEPLREVHEEAYPWIGRAIALISLGERARAAEELREVYLAWRQASGRAANNHGREAVHRGTARARSFVSWKLRRARLRLDQAAREALAKASGRLGDEGTAVAWRGKSAIDAHPRAYESIVREAGASFGVDPNLLWSVMRVESVYHKEIVSYAGAVGLMQIMPGTGYRIADALDLEGFSVEDLLNPRINVGFAAWYLRSLIERFDGNLPLAIASYNGGPHNVRRWMLEQGPDVSLDLFLERIPFSQTHRYVRRVLTHYAFYRAKAKKAPHPLPLHLPPLARDELGF